MYGLLTGTVGFLTAYAFVRRIYGYVLDALLCQHLLIAFELIAIFYEGLESHANAPLAVQLKQTRRWLYGESQLPPGFQSVMEVRYE